MRVVSGRSVLILRDRLLVLLPLLDVSDSLPDWYLLPLLEPIDEDLLSLFFFGGTFGGPGVSCLLVG